MIECPYLTEKKTCSLIDEGVGLPIVLHESVCEYCVKNYKDPETRKDSYAVKARIYTDRKRLGLPVGEMPERPRKPTMQAAQRDHAPRPNIADEMLAAARTVPRRTPAPVVSEPEARLAICEDCTDWSSTNQKCKASCGTCANRPRPMAEKGRDCPRGLWRRQ